LSFFAESELELSVVGDVDARRTALVERGRDAAGIRRLQKLLAGLARRIDAIVTRNS
jgi:hypothetical protein